MTKAYENFLSQYHASGKNKGDGYDRSHFNGLTEEEFRTVQNILITDAMQFDTTAIQGLGVLKSKESENVLRHLLTITKPPSYNHLKVTEALWETTHDLVLQENILEDYASNDEELKRLAAIGLLFTEPSSISYKTFIGILLTANKESDLRYTAVRGILLYYGLLPTAHDYENYQKYLPIVHLLLKTTDETSLAAALAEVEKEAAKIKKV